MKIFQDIDFGEKYRKIVIFQKYSNISKMDQISKMSNFIMLYCHSIILKGDVKDWYRYGLYEGGMIHLGENFSGYRFRAKIS